MIPVNEPVVGKEEKRLLAECIDSGWISSEGPFVAQFEKEMAARTNREYGIAVCNGSAALEVAVAALKLGPGDEVIMPTLTIISCAAAVVRAGAQPVLVDCDPRTWNMDVQQLESRLPSGPGPSWSCISTACPWRWTRCCRSLENMVCR